MEIQDFCGFIFKDPLLLTLELHMDCDCFKNSIFVDVTSHSWGQNLRVWGIIYANNQAKSFESREFTWELTQPSKHLFLFK